LALFLCPCRVHGLQLLTINVAITALIWVILAVSMNFITGTTGLSPWGTAPFTGSGPIPRPYCSAPSWGFPSCSPCPCPALVAALVGIGVALPTMRLVFIYFAVATLAIGEIIYVTLLNWVSFTRGPMGIDGVCPWISSAVEMESNLSIYMMTAAITAISVYVIYKLTHSYLRQRAQVLPRG
jgi:branched-chain amino acid transport system permease protein